MTGFENYKPNLFPRLTKLSHFLLDQYTSPPNTGAAPLLDELLMTEDVAGAGQLSLDYYE